MTHPADQPTPPTGPRPERRYAPGLTAPDPDPARP